MIGFVVCIGTSKSDELEDCRDQCEIDVGNGPRGNPKFHECMKEMRRKRAECETSSDVTIIDGIAIRNAGKCLDIDGECNEGQTLPGKDMHTCLCKCEAKFPNQENFGEFKVTPQNSPCNKVDPNSDEEKSTDE